jgi:hypothetical protein
VKGRRVRKINVVPPWPIAVGGLPLIWGEWEEGVRIAYKKRYGRRLRL